MFTSKATKFGSIISAALKLAILFGIVPNQALGNEGFFTDPSPLPWPVRSALDSTFLIGPSSREGGSGSAFVVKRERRPDLNQDLLYFLTSDHNIASNCGEANTCDSIMITASKVLDYSKGSYFKSNDRRLNFLKFEFVNRSKNPDLALLRVRIPVGAHADVTPLPIANCGQIQENDQVYILGFPFVAKRKLWLGNIAPDPFVLKLRWSTGVVAGYSDDTKEFNEPAHYVDTTADSLPGLSGGPVVNSSGRVVAVLDGVNPIVDPNFEPFVGNAHSVPKGVHAKGIRCEYLEAFINNRYVSLDPNDYYKDREEQVAAAR